MRGQGITDKGQAVSFAPGCSLTALLAAIPGDFPADRVYICGELPPNYGEWLVDANMFRDYTTGKRGIFLDRKKATGHVARFAHRVTGHEIEVRTMFAWLGDMVYTVEEARAAIELLGQYLRGAFTEQVKPYATPSLTFQQLWLLENRLHGAVYELLPENVRQLIRDTTGQGRIELLTAPELEKITTLNYYDGIFMYAGKAWGMPAKLLHHDNENTYAGKSPARYRIRYTIPQDWPHIGVFPTLRGQGDNAEWCYPGDTCQGQTYETWVDGAEIDVLVQHYATYPRQWAEDKAERTRQKQEAEIEGQARAFTAWHIVIVERLVFEPGRALDGITKKLVTMRDKVEHDAQMDTSRAPIYALVRAMIRNILLHGIGSFHRENRDMTYILRENEPAPDGYTDVRPFSAGMLTFTVPQKTEKYTQQFEHPEYSSAIWGRTRASMTRAALSLPRKSLIAIRTDAIATTQERPDWNSNTRIGQLRRKWAIHRAVKAPHSFEDFDKLVHRYVKGER
jgi:hypothetical protein